MTSQDRLIQKERQLLQVFEEATDNRKLAESISNDFEWYDRESLRLENSPLGNFRAQPLCRRD